MISEKFLAGLTTTCGGFVALEILSAEINAAVNATGGAIGTTIASVAVAYLACCTFGCAAAVSNNPNVLKHKRKSNKLIWKIKHQIWIT